MGAPRIHVLHLIKGLDRGGAERLLTHMVTDDEGDSFDHEVAFVRTDMHELVGELESAGIRVHDLGAEGDFHVAWTLRLRRLLVANRYDVMHAHSPYAAGLARLTTRTMAPRRRPRLVYTEHSRWEHNTAASRVLGWTTSHWDDVRIAVAETNRAALPAHLRRGTRVIRHGIDLERLGVSGDHRAVRAELGLAMDEPLVVTVANLTAQKGYPTLLAATRVLLDEGFSLTVLSAGSGPIADELEQLRVDMGLGQHFRFLGQRPDARALIAASDVMVLASDWECMPVVVMEAFALGTPVVATAVGELPLIIDSEVNGLLVPPGDPQALAAALRRVLADDTLRSRLGRAAADSAGVFDVRHARKEMASVYAELVTP